MILLLLRLMFFMSLTGSAFFLSFTGISAATRKRPLTCQARYRLLKANLAFFLLPFPLLTLDLKQLIRLAFPDFGVTPSIPGQRIYMDLSNTIFISGTGPEKVLQYPRISLPGWGICLLLGGVCLFLILKNLWQYWQLRNYLSQRKVRQIGEEEPEALDVRALCRELPLKRPVRIWKISGNFSPCVRGMFCIHIYLPERFSNPSRLILKHELIHAKRWDSLAKLLLLFTLLLNWYNPLVYLFYRSFLNLCELSCDELTLKGASLEQRRAYGNLLLDFSQQRIIPNPVTVNALFHKQSLLKERIMMIKNPNSRHLKKPAAALAMALLLVMSSLPVLAYELPTVDVTENPATGKFNPDGIVTEYYFVEGGEPTPVEPLPAEYFFTDESGTVYPLEETEEVYAACKHSYISGTTSQHTRDGNGGCTVETYQAKRCTKCGHVEKGKRISSTYYDECPHK